MNPEGTCVQKKSSDLAEVRAKAYSSLVAEGYHLSFHIDSQNDAQMRKTVAEFERSGFDVVVRRDAYEGPGELNPDKAAVLLRRKALPKCEVCYRIR